MYYIFLRAVRQQYRQKGTLLNDILLAIISGTIVGLVYRNPTPVQV